jgi:predicted amidohydrolase YtcJ
MWVSGAPLGPAGGHSDSDNDILPEINSPYWKDAIVSATSTAADLIGAPAKIGKIASVSYADMIVVHGDPLSHIQELENVAFVMRGGVIYKQSTVGGTSKE